MNVTLSKKDWLCEYNDINSSTVPITLVANGLTLNLKRITLSNEDLSLTINLENSKVDLVNKIITLKVKNSHQHKQPEADILINVTDYEVAQIRLLLNNYRDMLNQQVDSQLKNTYLS